MFYIVNSTSGKVVSYHPLDSSKNPRMGWLKLPKKPCLFDTKKDAEIFANLLCQLRGYDTLKIESSND